MEFLDDDPRPRFHFQSRSLPAAAAAASLSNPQTQQIPPNKPFLFITVCLSSLLLLLSIFFFQIEPFRSILFWVSSSLLIGPFAPSHLTGGDIRVGHGPILEEPLDQGEPEILTEKQARKKRFKPVRSEEIVANPIQAAEITNGVSGKDKKIESLAISENGLARNEGEKEWKDKKIESLAINENGLARNEVEKEWSEGDIEILKKQLVKHPVGKPRRWEVISEAFNGRHGVDSVIKKAKQLGEKKLDDSDSYTRFLKNRKPLDNRIQGENLEQEGSESKKDSDDCWSGGDDIALLNALKAFPKDVAMRWEKIAAAVPGKSKAACMKRVAELKRDFRNSKAVAES